MRELRVQEAKTIFHVINRGNAKRQLFFEKSDYQVFKNFISKYKKKFCVKIYHYVLMPNHIHLLLETATNNTLSKFMHGLTLAYSKWCNKKQNKTGHVWQDRYKNFVIENDSYFLQCGRYIELNPIRAGIVKHPSHYQWSSYHAYAFNITDPLLDINTFYLDLGSSPEKRGLEYQQITINDPTPWYQVPIVQA